MARKKYYWLKLKNDFFRQKEIKKLRQIAGGDTYVIIYLKMQLLSLQNNGRLFFEGYEDTFANELALELGLATLFWTKLLRTRNYFNYSSYPADFRVFNPLYSTGVR